MSKGMNYDTAKELFEAVERAKQGEPTAIRQNGVIVAAVTPVHAAVTETTAVQLPPELPKPYCPACGFDGTKHASQSFCPPGAHPFDDTAPDNDSVLLGEFPDLVAALARKLLASNQAKNHFGAATYMQSLFQDVAEEAGEANKAHRRYIGYARQSATAKEVKEELCDSIIASSVALISFATHGGWQFGAADFGELLSNRLSKVLDRYQEET